MDAEDELDSGVCNCCLNEGPVRSMIERTSSGDVCTQLILLCFGLDVMVTNIGDRKRVICRTCERQLRDSLHFRHQVERSLCVLEEEAKATDTDTKDECVNAEDYGYDTFIDDGLISACAFTDDGVKNEPTLSEAEEEVLKLLRPKRKSKEPPPEHVKVKKKRQKPSAMPTVQAMNAFLESGLFPFKRWKDKYVCYCHHKFATLKHLSDHMSEHTETFKLDSIKKMVRLKNNSRFEIVSSKLRCARCGELVENFDSLERHSSECKSKGKDEKKVAAIQTGISNKEMKNSASNGFTEHIRAHWQQRRESIKNGTRLPFKLEKDQVDCPICHKRFLNYCSLNIHMNVHYPNYICESCGKAFANKHRLKSHIRIHELGEFPCKLCHMVFDKVTKRESHVSKQHRSGVRYSCPHCGIMLKSFYSRQKHLADAHNEELKRYKCALCPQSYITPGHLSSHVRKDHLNERNHKCDKCELAFYTRNSLTTHMIKHVGERIFTCDICSKSYQRAKTLNEHMRIHNNDKRFVCPVCGRAFTQKCTLKNHLKLHERRREVENADGMYARHSV